MFEVTGDDIAHLQPGELRELVGRLARAELRSAGRSIAGVTAGGHENAPDGGIDVRVSCSAETFRPGFVPRSESGFQVKQTAMHPGDIAREMRPGSALRPAIVHLTEIGGAYIIVSGKESIADGLLLDRQQAMQNALHDQPGAHRLETKFYDRERVADWTNMYPGAAAWVRTRVGRPLTGWRSMDDLTAARMPFLHDDVACLTDGCGTSLTIFAGIDRLREVLRKPGVSARIVGLSGVGKTRMVQALFEPEVGGAALDSAIGAYGDEGERLAPTAHDIARGLIAARTRAILILDNCNPETHRTLTEIAGAPDSTISLLTVEYDVRDDLPEGTEVFRLEAASLQLLISWLQTNFPDVCQADCERIATFSDGNFRIAGAIAGSIGKGETIGHLRDRILFERIVQQRNVYDEGLQRAAEDLSLLYSIDGEATGPDSELARIGSLRGIAADTLYSHLVTLLRQRGIVQARGRWRAVLPQAVANALARYALDRVPPATLDKFVAGLPERMQRSLTRRIGYLHDIPVTLATVQRWLTDSGPFGDLCVPEIEKATILLNLAPVAPGLALDRITCVLAGPNAAALLSPRSPTRTEWIRLIKSLAYDADLFKPAADLLIKFVVAEGTDNHHQSAMGAFQELFLIFLSGTRASPEHRRAVISRLADSGNADEQKLATIGLTELLGDRHSATNLHDFGARSRDYGWAPADQRDVSEWYTQAIDLAARLSPIIPQTREILAESLRDLWHVPSCLDAFARAGEALARQSVWIEGWLAARATLRNNVSMPAELHEHLIEIIEQFKPNNLLDFARAVLLGSRPGNYDFSDGGPDSEDMKVRWRRAGLTAREIGQMMAKNDDRRRQFLPELLSQRGSTHSHEFGRGLADATADLRMTWAELMGHLRQIAYLQRVGSALGGFLLEGRDRDPSFARTALDQIANDPVLAHMLPFLQALSGLNEEGVERMRRVIAIGTVAASEFNVLSFHPPVIRPEILCTLLHELAELPDGVGVCVGILHFRFLGDAENGNAISPLLIEVGCALLRRVTITPQSLRDHVLQNLMQRCSAGPAGARMAAEFSIRLREAVLAGDLQPHNLTGTFQALVAAQPAAVLDVFVPAEPTWQDERVLHHGFGSGAALDRIDPIRVREWADLQPEGRYQRLGRMLSMFSSALGGKPQELSPVFTALLETAPDRVGFLGEAGRRIYRSGWSGSLADTLEQRRMLLLTLQDGTHPEVRQWVSGALSDLASSIADAEASEREREQRREGSFE